MRFSGMLLLAGLAALQATPCFAGKYIALNDSPERRQATEIVAKACPKPANYPREEDNMWGMFQNADVGRRASQGPVEATYVCYMRIAEKRWSAALQNMSPAMADYRQKCAQARENFADEMVKQGANDFGTKTDALGVLDFYFGLLGDDASAIQASISNPKSPLPGPGRAMYPMPAAEYQLELCQGQTRIEQLRSGRNVQLDSVLD